MFASAEFLGVRAAHVVDYYVIASPAGNYFTRGVQPLVVWIADQYSRAGAGGTGAAKCGGNYASSLLAKDEAAENGADEVMFQIGRASCRERVEIQVVAESLII